MSWRMSWAVAIWAAAALLTLPVHGQVEQGGQLRADVSQRAVTSAERIAHSADSPIADSVVCEIDDPATGDRWLLERDAAHPQRPGRMTLMPSRGQTNDAQISSAASPKDTSGAAPALVIHGGDRVIVEEHTPVVDARLEAVAMGPAAVGAEFRVRLRIGGRAIAAVATSKGHALVASPIGGPQ
jgi:hypothetical protein